MLKKTLIRAGIGFLIGVVIGYVISILTGSDNPDVFIPVSDKLLSFAGSIPMALVLQGLFSGIYGAICFGAVSFYDIEKWPLALATGMHCAVIILLFIPGGIFLGWVNSVTEALIMAGMQFVAFFIIWLILYFSYRKQVKELNEMQEHFQDKNSNDNKKEGN